MILIVPGTGGAPANSFGGGRSFADGGTSPTEDKAAGEEAIEDPLWPARGGTAP